MITSQPESKLIILKSLANEIEEALKNDQKWVSVIDVEGNAEVYFKYQGTSVFSILEKEIAPENLCRSILTMVKYPRTLTINYLDLPYNSIFHETYFPEEVLDVKWIMDFNNIEKLRQNFLQEFPEEIFPCKDFKMCFLFRKDNVPELLHQKTNVLEICAPSEIAELREQREEARKAREASAKLEEEKKVEEPKVEAKKPAITSKSTSSSKTTGATVKTQAKVNVSAAPKTGVTSKTTSTPVKTTTTVTKTGTGSKTTMVTATATTKTSSTTTKVTTKK